MRAGTSCIHNPDLEGRAPARWPISMSAKPSLPGPDGIAPILLKDALEERTLADALSTIMHRAVPDVRDGED